MSDVLDRVDSDTDIMSAVDGAFKELDCCSQRKDQLACGGDIAGYQEFHDCVQGWLCENHWKLAIDVLYPAWRAKLDESKAIRCVHCLNVFHHIREYVRLTPV